VGYGDNEFGQLGDGFVDAGTATPEQIFPSPQPVLAQAVSSNTNLQFMATCGFGGNFLSAGQHEHCPAFEQWTPVWTNVITSRYANIFSATLTTVNSGSQQFYILQSP